MLRFKSAGEPENAGMASSSYGVTEWVVEYILSEPCGYTKIQNSPSIELRSEHDVTSNSERIIGFSIKVTGEYDAKEVLKKANQQAKRLADIITFKREKRVTSHLAGFRKKTGADASPDANFLLVTESASAIMDAIV
jgi:hypothetical protein